jgi:F-type H+-transporting ATPase subunit epsilon
MSSFEVGKIRIQLSDETEVIFATGGGVIEVKQNKVLVLADSLERAEEIDIQRAEASADRARQRLQNKSDSSIDSPRAEIALLRAINRLKIAGRR